MPQSAPHSLAFVAALICGTLTALVTHILIAAYGLTLAAPWLDLFPAESAKFKAALAWWAIAAGGGLGGALAFRLLRGPAVFAALRGGAVLRLLATLALFALLVFAAHAATHGEVHGQVFTLTALATMTLGAFTAFCGVYLCAAAPERIAS